MSPYVPVVDNQQSHHPTQRQPDTTLDSAGISFALAIQLHDLCSCATSGLDTMVLFGDFLELDGALKDCCLQRGLPALRAEHRADDARNVS